MCTILEGDYPGDNHAFLISLLILELNAKSLKGGGREARMRGRELAVMSGRRFRGYTRLQDRLYGLLKCSWCILYFIVSYFL